MEGFSLALDAVQGIVPIRFSLTASVHKATTMRVNMKTTLQYNVVRIKFQTRSKDPTNLLLSSACRFCSPSQEADQGVIQACW